MNDSLGVSTGAPRPASALVDIRGAGQILGLSYWQVYNLIREGELPVITVGVKLYLRRATVLRWAEKSEAKHRVA
jgi:excisionase family DNA binding protein